jgi:hypothetical protein
VCAGAVYGGVCAGVENGGCGFGCGMFVWVWWV